LEITPTTLTINQLFGSNNEQFFVPAYQRRYSWKSKQVVDIFRDIDRLPSGDTHLLGTIVCLTKSHTAGINTLELIDGQQRITTLTLLFKALMDRFNELGMADSVTELRPCLFCKGLDQQRQKKLKLGDLDEPDYAAILSDDPEGIVNLALWDAYVYFKQMFTGLDNDSLARFSHKLLNYTKVIRLDVSQARDAYKLFETINDRGLRLTPTDIIKNYLLGNASLINEETLQKVSDAWRDLIVELDGIGTDTFFRQYLASTLRRKIVESKLILEFKKVVRRSVAEIQGIDENGYQESPESDEEEDGDNGVQEVEAVTEDNDDFERVTLVQFARDLAVHAAVYRKIYRCCFDNTRVNEHLANLIHIKSLASYVFLIDLFQRGLSDQTIVGVLEAIETFMLRRNICRYRTGELEPIFASLVKLPNEGIVEGVKRDLRPHTPSDEEFQSRLPTYEFFGNLKDRAKYILKVIEYHLMNGPGEFALRSFTDVHLEHIIPQTIETKKSVREFGDWISYLGGEKVLERHKQYVNLIGNMTLLLGELNISASNNPYQAKVKEYEKSKVLLTKTLVEKFQDFRFDDVVYRSGELARLAVGIWRI